MSDQLRLLVCGGRAYHDSDVIFTCLRHIHPSLVIHGGCRGVDELAGEWCGGVVPQMIFLANWGQYGLAAGPIRNQQMLDEGKPDAFIAFPGGKGTDDMIRRARAAGIIEINYELAYNGELDDIQEKLRAR